MASLRPPSADTRLTRDQRSPSPRSRDHDVHDGQSLPGGSSLFQEVMAELHPPSPSTPIPKSPAARRRKSSQVKHVHYAMDTGGRRKKEEPPLSQQEDGEEEEEEVVAGPEKQILHGKCHCYFVEHGNVTGLADHHCHHQHRLLHPLQASPMSSPRPSRKTTSTPEGSPPPRNKHHHPNHHHHHNHHNHHTSLQLPEADSFRGRSHSDCAVMARVCKSKKAASLSPSSSSSFSSSASPSRGKTSPVRGGTPDKIRVPPIRRSASLRHDDSEVRSESALSALRISSPLPPPPPILVQDASDPGGERRGRRPSTHSVDSQQLHYLYDQFLSPGSGGSSSGHG